MSHLPPSYQRFQADHLAVWEAYDQLAIPSIGFPASMAALTWVEDVLQGEA